MTSTTDTDLQILKTDVLGRVRMPRERREAILDEFERSGMSGQAFARHIGVKYSTFATWAQKRRRKQGFDQPKKTGSGDSRVQLFEAVVAPEPSSLRGCLEVETPQGVKFRLHNTAEAKLAAEFLRALNGGRAC